MKKIAILVLVLSISIISCKAQYVIPVDDGYKYIGTDEGFMGDKNYVYVKDINNVLPKFLGTWKGTFNNYNYEFLINQTTIDDGELKEDILVMRYKITDFAGTIIENTLDLPNESSYVMKNGYMSKAGGYFLSYLGKNASCGQHGWVYIQVYGLDNNKLQLFLQVGGEIYPECTTGKAEQILPLQSIELVKQ